MCFRYIWISVPWMLSTAKIYFRSLTFNFAPCGAFTNQFKQSAIYAWWSSTLFSLYPQLLSSGRQSFLYFFQIIHLFSIHFGKRHFRHFCFVWNLALSLKHTLRKTIHWFTLMYRLLVNVPFLYGTKGQLSVLLGGLQRIRANIHRLSNDKMLIRSEISYYGSRSNKAHSSSTSLVS